MIGKELTANYELIERLNLGIQCLMLVITKVILSFYPVKCD